MKNIIPAFAKYGLLAAGVLLHSCTSPVPEKSILTPAFYHWKTELTWNEAEAEYLNRLAVEKIYLRFFDVDWSEAKQQLVPLAEVRQAEKLPDQYQLVPTVFITNRSLLKGSEEEMSVLCERLLAKIETIAAESGLLNYREIQIDCDWSAQTRARYFELLDCLRRQLIKKEIQLSCTIRLHQVKFFRQTGVPPADRGMLMFYNTGQLTELETDNSILDLAEAEKYFVNFEAYPLDLDLALPIFSWGVLFRDGKMIKLIHNLSKAELSDTLRFTKLDPIRYQVAKSTYLQAHYLYQSDLLRLEQIEAAQLEEAVKMLKKIINHPQVTISFYHLDQTALNNHPYEELERILAIWTQQSR